MSKKRLKVSFDYDGTLSTKEGKKKAKKHIERGDNVYITTARPKDWHGERWDNTEVFEAAENLGIPKNKIRFLDFDDKWKHLKEFDFHFDDDKTEIELINANTTCKGVLVKY